ncbi:MAG: PHP domain-containing protein [Erysipelotrichaceae bacterium]
MIDLHIHTTYSDGEVSLLGVLKKAQQLSLSWIALCDHENMDSNQALKNIDYKKYFQGNILPACEIAFLYKGMLMDMLAYGVQYEKMEAFHLLKHHNQNEMIKQQQVKLDKMKVVAKQLGLMYSETLMINKTSERANDVICDDLLSYSSNQEVLKAMNILNRTTFYRSHYLNQQSPFYMQNEMVAPSLNEVAYAIHESGGLCFLAHPFVYDVEDHEVLLNELIETNLFDGIECIHRRHTRCNSDWLINFCNQHDLFKSGGSDYHLLTHDMGYGNQGQIAIEGSLIEPWIKKINTR